jgi:uncharacterized protein (DUF1499 family)
VETPSRVAVVAQRLGIVAVILVVLGPLMNQIPGVPPMAGFLTFALGLLDGLVALLLGTVALVITRPASGVGGRRQALTAVGIGLGIFVLVLGINSGGMGGPRINDITTDMVDPPAYVAIARIESDRDYTYPGEDFASQQEAAYPDVMSWELALPPDQAFAAARQAALDLGWEIVEEDPAGGRLEAMDTTALFRFVDDIVVRIRPGRTGSRIDMRSKSRDGKGDVGANAARIRAFKAAVKP